MSGPETTNAARLETKLVSTTPGATGFPPLDGILVEQRARAAQYWVRLAVFGLLAFYAILALATANRRGLTFDESEELASGYNIWLNHDFRMEGANGDFVKRWATVPFLVSQPNFPATTDSNWLKGEPYVLGYEFFFVNGNNPRGLLLQGRLMVILLGLATGWLVFVCARDIFGLAGGLLALGLFVFSENMLAYGGLVSTEMSTCFGLLGTTWSVWRLLHEVTWGRLVTSLLFTAVLVLSKLSAIVIFPIVLILLAVKLVCGRPLWWRLGWERMIRRRSVQAGIFTGFILLHACVGWAALWAHYDFRYASSPAPDNPQVRLTAPDYIDPIDETMLATLKWCRETHFLPQGFLNGVELLLGQNDERMSFMNGEWKTGGWRTFFIYSMWAKTSPTFLLLLALGLVGCWRWRRGGVPATAGLARPATCESFPPGYGIIPYVTLVIVYAAVAVLQNVDIGHRHILPIYPALFILAGGAVALLWGRWAFSLRVLIGLLLLARMGESIATYPHYLAYFSPLVGGPEQAYKHLVDSSLDWGTGLRGLKRWLDTNNPGGHAPVYLAYFGTDSPDYHGIQAKRLPGFFDWRPREFFPLAPGIYAISATLFQSLYTPVFGPWNKQYELDYQVTLKLMQEFEHSTNDPAQRAALIAAHPPGFWENIYSGFDSLRFGRLCAWLRHNREPDDNAGYSILIFRLSLKDLQAALLGPPAEMAETPPKLQERAKQMGQPLPAK